MELAAVIAAAALLFTLALGIQKLFFPNPVPAPDISLSLEQSLRSLMLKQIASEEKIVDKPPVAAAFSAIESRLLPALGKLPYDVQVIVVDSPVINAVTLPGGVVVVYSGLIRRLDSPEEMAAILAHELGHVANRDPITLLERQMGMNALMTVLTGGRGQNLAQDAITTLVGRHYSREAEDRADAFALQILPKAGIDPSAFADAMTRLKESRDKEPPAIMRYLDPHSAVDERIARARQAPRPPDFRPRKLDVHWKQVEAALPKALEPAN